MANDNQYTPASWEEINRQQNSPPVQNSPWMPRQETVSPANPNLGQPPLDYREGITPNTQINAPAMLPPTAHQPITDPYEQYAQAMHGQANQAYEKHLQQFPQYQSPGIFNKIVAGLGGASAGYFGGAGEGLKVGQAYLNAPYNQQISRWQQQNQPLAQAAGIEARQAAHILDPMRLFLQQQHQQAQDKAAAERAAATTAGVGIKQGQLDLNKTAAKTPEERLAALEGVQAKTELAGAQTTALETKPRKAVERTVDLGDKVEYIYTDGSRETKPKGVSPGSALQTQRPRFVQYTSRDGQQSQMVNVNDPEEKARVEAMDWLPGAASKLTGKERDTYETTKEMQQLLDDIETKYKPGYVGALEGSVFGRAKEFTGAIGQEESDFRVATQSLLNQIGKLRAGSTWTSGEITRLYKELPNAGMSDQQFISALNRAKTTMQRKLDAIESVGKATGVRTPGAGGGGSTTKEIDDAARTYLTNTPPPTTVDEIVKSKMKKLGQR